jgi:hypothetical protein
MIAFTYIYMCLGLGICFIYQGIRKNISCIFLFIKNEFLYIYVYIYIHMHIYICIHICIYIYMYMLRSGDILYIPRYMKEYKLYYKEIIIHIYISPMITTTSMTTHRWHCRFVAAIYESTSHL